MDRIDTPPSALSTPPGLGTARLDVRLDAVVANWRECARLSGTAVAGVVKADAYGLGMEAVARALDEAGCDTFFVARLEEGIALRPIVPDARIFVLDGAAPDAVPALIAHRLTPVLNSLADLANWQSAERRDAALHIDTGMNRLGLPPDELATLVAQSKTRLAGIRPVLLMSHLACADDPAHEMNEMQRNRFRAALAKLPPAPASLASSGGILLGRDYAFDLVRPGLGLYGATPQTGRPNPFQTAVRLTGKILQLRRVDYGQTVGYGASYRTGRDSTLATVALGYADGLMRVIGNRGKASIAGTRVAIVGRVSMDLITLDVTDLVHTAKVGDDAEFLGDTISLEELAADSGTAPYEILTSLGHRVPRRYEAIR
jgi:alanine racemase